MNGGGGHRDGNRNVSKTGPTNSVITAASGTPTGRYDSSPCVECRARRSNFCGALDLERGALKQFHRSTPARRLSYRAGDPTDDFHVICDGWAAASVRLSDGRRQILSFLIPGDIVSVAALFQARQSFSVQSLTDVRYCSFNRAELQAELGTNPKVFQGFVQTGIAEKEMTNQTIINLGRASAPARIARLILSLMARLAARGLVDGMEFDLPLRQQHIADATGLTTVHVSRVVNKFRKESLVDLARRRIRIVNLAELQRVADEG